MSTNIAIPPETLAAFCREHHIRRLALFGSVLRDDFNDASDVDVLVDFDPAARVGLITLAGIEIELASIFGRRVEIHTQQGLNPRLRDDVLRTAEVQYEYA